MKKTVLIKRIALMLMVVGILSLAACSGRNGEIDIDKIITSTTSTQPQDSVPTPTMELEFELNKDGISYYVKSLGTCSDSEIYIPDTYEGKPVTAIGEGAFRECANLTYVIIPDSVKIIGEYAFYGCVSLTEITIGENVLNVGNYAFYGCINITVINYNANGVYDFQENNNVFTDAGINGDGITLNIGVNVVGIPKNCFNPTGSVETAPNIKEINFEDGSNCEIIGENAFYLCVNIKILVIPDSVQMIDPLAFYGCEGLQELTIGEGITWIGEGAFSQCVNITVINFNAIMIDEYGFVEGEKHPFTNIARDSDGVIVNIGVNVTVIPNNFFFTGDIDNPINVKEVNFADGCKCESIGQNAFSFCINITVFSIPNGVTTIGDYAFYGCYGLEELTIGESVVSIGRSAFGECNGLISLTIGENVKSIGDYAFFSCTNITIINFNAILMNDLKENNNVFNDVGKDGKGITVNVGSNVKAIPDNLFNPSDLTSTAPTINEVNFADNSQCEEIGYKAFYRCINIVVIKIPAGIVSIGEKAFYGCTNLETIYYDAVNIINLPENAFKNAGKNGVKVIININVIVLPDSFFYNESGENIFVDVKWNDGTKCEHPHVWSDWQTTKEPSCTSTGLKERVCNCGEKQIKVLSTKGHTEVIDDAVAPSCTETGLSEGKHCSACNTVLVAQTVISANGHTEVIDNAVEPTCTATGLSEGKHCSVCNTILVEQTTVAPKGHSFSEWNTLKEATLKEEGLKERTCYCGEKQTELIPKLQLIASEGLEFELNSDSASYTVSRIGNCTDRDIIIPATYNGLPVVSIGEEAFYGCESLISITIPDSVTSIGKAAFNWCDSLKSVTIGDGVTSIDDSAFAVCIKLRRIDVSENNEYYKSIDGNLYSKDGKTLVKYATGKTDTSFTISNDVTSIVSYAFNRCESLIRVIIPDSVTNIGVYAFYGCSSLEYNKWGDVYYLGNDNNPYFALIGTKTDYIQSCYLHDDTKIIAGAAFYGYGWLKSITIPNGVITIGDYAFGACESLTGITIPASVTSIGKNAFFWGELTRVTFKDADGWYVTQTSGEATGINLTLTDASTNATYLVRTYLHYYWYKK